MLVSSFLSTIVAPTDLLCRQEKKMQTLPVLRSVIVTVCISLVSYNHNYDKIIEIDRLTNYKICGHLLLLSDIFYCEIKRQEHAFRQC